MVIEHENEVNAWRAKQMKLESENGRLTASLKIL